MENNAASAVRTEKVLPESHPTSPPAWLQTQSPTPLTPSLYHMAHATISRIYSIPQSPIHGKAMDGRSQVALSGLPTHSPTPLTPSIYTTTTVIIYLYRR